MSTAQHFENYLLVTKLILPQTQLFEQTNKRKTDRRYRLERQISGCQKPKSGTADIELLLIHG